MIIKGKEFKFIGGVLDCRPIEYTIHWEKYLTNSVVTISRSSLFDESRKNRLEFSSKDIPDFIKELQTLVEFMKNDGLLVEDEEETQNEDRRCGSNHQPG